ncbi:MAG: hypothetical protein ABI212_14610 [Burkholderiaceae bacterium]
MDEILVGCNEEAFNHPASARVGPPSMAERHGSDEISGLTRQQEVALAVFDLHELGRRQLRGALRQAFVALHPAQASCRRSQASKG